MIARIVEFIRLGQEFIVPALVVILLITITAWACIVIMPSVCAAVKRFFGSMSIVGKIICGALIVCWVQMGSTKSKVTCDNSGGIGLFDNGSLATNNTITARWTFRGIPGAAQVFIDRRPYGSDEEWTNIGETIASALSWEAATAYPATNDEYFVWWYYNPPAPVHTNGVWVGNAYKTRNGGKGFITINSTITDHGKVIATPEQKRKAAENE